MKKPLVYAVVPSKNMRGRHSVPNGIFDEFVMVGYTFLHLPHPFDPVFWPLFVLKAEGIPVNDQVIQYQGQRQTEFTPVKLRKLQTS